jgi:septal ring factor EnvC (AmiA/AmiB activator)
MTGRAFVGVLMLAAAEMIAATALATNADLQRGELEELRQRIGGLQAEIETKSGEKTELTRMLRDSEQQIGRMTRSLRILDERLERQSQRLDDLRLQQKAQQTALDQQRATLARQVRAAYAMGRQERLKVLLNQQDPATLSRVMAYYDYMSKARAAKMAGIRRQLQALATTGEAIRNEEQQLVQLRQAQQDEIAALQSSQAIRREVLARLSRQLTDRGRQLARLKDDERELETLLRGLEEALSDIPSTHPLQARFDRRRGSLPWPASGKIAERFGAPKLGSLVWDGVIIAAPEGKEVRAVHHGRVAYADWLRGFGLLLIVDHGDGYMTLYGHNQSIFKEIGDWVEENEPIALVGTSGGREHSGVYFGIRYQGRPIDPVRWCRRGKGGRVG